MMRWPSINGSWRPRPELTITHYFIATAHDNLGEYEEALASYELFLTNANQKTNELEIEKVKLRLPSLRRQIQLGQGVKKNEKSPQELTGPRNDQHHGVPTRNVSSCTNHPSDHCHERDCERTGTVIVLRIVSPPPLKTISRVERSQIDEADDSKSRVKITLALAETHLVNAEARTSQNDFAGASAAIGRYGALIEDVFRFSENQQSG